MVCGGRLGWPLRLRCVETVRRSSGEMCSERCGLFRAHLRDHTILLVLREYMIGFRLK